MRLLCILADVMVFLLLFHGFKMRIIDTVTLTIAIIIINNVTVMPVTSAALVFLRPLLASVVEEVVFIFQYHLSLSFRHISSLCHCAHVHVTCTHMQ